MKKAKIALAALVALTVVSGSLAFTVQKTFGSTVYVGDSAGGPITETKVGWGITSSTFPGAKKTFVTNTIDGTLAETYITEVQ